MILPRKFPNGTSLIGDIRKVLCNDDSSNGDDDDDNMETSQLDSPYLSIASYNLLAPLYVRPIDKRTGSVQPFAAFEWVSEEDSENVLDIANRGPRLLEAMRNSNADIICLQELQLDRRKPSNESSDDNDQSIVCPEGGTTSFVLQPWIRPLIENDGYKIHLPSDDELEIIAARNIRVLDADSPVTCAILYKSEKIEALSPSQTNESPSTAAAEDSPKKKAKKAGSNGKHKSRGDTNTCVSLCVKLKDFTNEADISPVVITSVHLDATDERRRMSQLTKALKRARQLQDDCIATKESNQDQQKSLRPISTIMAGDFNTDCFNGSCVGAVLEESLESPANDKEMEQQCAASHFLPKYQHPSKEQMKNWKELYIESQEMAKENCVSLSRVPTGATRAAYEHTADNSESNSNDNTQSSSPVMGQWRLDHMFYTTDTLRPCAFWSTLEDDVESRTIGLPNHKFGSDHLPIATIFQLQPNPKLDETTQTNLVEQIQQMNDTHSLQIQQLESKLQDELETIKSQLPPPPPDADAAEEMDTDAMQQTQPTQEQANNTKNDKKNDKKKKKKGPPAKEVVEFMRKKRSLIRDLKSNHVNERQDFLESLGNLERLFLQTNVFKIPISQWIQTGIFNFES